MEDCCDNKNIIFCGVIHDYKYIHEIPIYEN